MKHEDGTAMLVGGDQDQVVGRIADLYMQRRDHLRASGSQRTITVPVPTNADAADVSRATRERLKARGELGSDEVSYKAVDQRGETYTLPIATGDKPRLYRRTWARIAGRGGSIGNNGDVVEVLGRTENGLRLRDKEGRVGEVGWRWLADPRTGRPTPSFGHALTNDAAQGITSGERINALLRGSAGIRVFKAYVAESRRGGATWTVISEAAVHEVEKRSRALRDTSPVTEADLWKRVAADMASKPLQGARHGPGRRSTADRDRAVDAFIRQSHRLQMIVKEGRVPGHEIRRHVRVVAADRQLAGHGAALDGALQRNEPKCHRPRDQRPPAGHARRGRGCAGTDRGGDALGVRFAITRHVECQVIRIEAAPLSRPCRS